MGCLESPVPVARVVPASWALISSPSHVLIEIATPMKIALSWSSGKDSAWTLQVLRKQYPGCTAALVTTLNEAFDRVAMHAVRRTLLEAQADAAGLPLYAVDLPWPCPNDAYDER